MNNLLQHNDPMYDYASYNAHNDYDKQNSSFDKGYAVYRKHHKRIKPKHKHLYLWLPTHKLLSQFDDSSDDRKISDDCLHRIINKIYGSTTKFIEHLIQRRDEKELSDIYDILKQERLTQNIDNDIDLKTDNDNHFNILSSTSISHICSYLNKNEIRSFKAVSSLIAINCLKEMTKLEIGIFNMNEIIHQKEYQNLALFHLNKTDKLIKQNRYLSNTKFVNILELWSLRYNIDVKNMLLLYYNHDHIYDEMIGFRDRQNKLKPVSYFIQDFIKSGRIMDVEQDSFNNFYKPKCLLFDKSKMTIIYDAHKIYEEENKNAEPPKQAVNCEACTYLNPILNINCEICDTPIPKTVQIKKVLPFKKQCVVLLHYFDFQKQLITFVRFVLVHEKYSLNLMMKYIERNAVGLLKDYFESVQERDEFIEMVDKMQKFNMFSAKTLKLHDFGTDYLNLESVAMAQLTQRNMQCWVFSLNDTHPVFSNDYLRDMRSYYSTELNEQFHISPGELIHDIYKKIKYTIVSTDLRCNIYKYGNEAFEPISLSERVLEHICAFLMNDDVIALKAVSKAAALVCLREMRKIKINSLNMSEIESLAHFQDLISFKCVSLDDNVNFHRCHPSLTFNALLKIWSNEYDISMQDMLLLVSRKKYEMFSLQKQRNDVIFNSNIYRPRELQMSIKALQIFTKDMEIMNKYLFKKCKISEMKNYTFLVVDKTKLFKVKVDENEEQKFETFNVSDESEDPIIKLNEELNDYRVEAQLSAIRKLETISQTIGVERTVTELFALIREYCFPTFNTAKKYHTIPPNKNVIRAIYNTVNVQFIENCGLQNQVIQYIVPFLKKVRELLEINDDFQIWLEIKYSALNGQPKRKPAKHNNQSMEIEFYDEEDQTHSNSKSNEMKPLLETLAEIDDFRVEAEQLVRELISNVVRSLESDGSHDSEFDDESRSFDDINEEVIIAMEEKEDMTLLPNVLNTDIMINRNSSESIAVLSNFCSSEESKSGIDYDNSADTDVVNIDMNTHNNILLNDDGDIIANEEKCMIVLLYYFDLKNQKIQYCQTLMITENDNTTIGKLYKYIMSNLHDLISYDDGLYDLLHQMKKFGRECGDNCPMQQIFNIFIASFMNKNSMQCTKYDSDTFVFNNNKPFQVFIFELNDDHNYLIQTHKNYFKQIENYYSHILQRECYFDIHDLICDESITITMNYSNNNSNNNRISLRECINYYRSLNENKDQYYDINDGQMQDLPTCVRYKITPQTNALLLSKKIEKQLNYCVPLQSIVLYNDTNKYRIKWTQNMVDLGIFTYDITQQQMVSSNVRNIKIAWSITPTSLLTIAANDQQIEMYNVKIYEPNCNNIFENGYELQLPFRHDALYVPFKRIFAVHEFIAYIKQICHGLYENRYEKYLKYFTNEQYSFVIGLSNANNNDTEIVENCYDGNDIIEFRGQTVSIFIINNEKYKDDEQYNVLVRFTTANDYKNKYSNHFVYERCVGRPERIWFEKNDKTEDILREFGFAVSDKILSNSKVFYFYNKGNKVSHLRKCVLQNDKSIYDSVINPQQNNGNMKRVLLVSVPENPNVHLSVIQET